MYTQCPECLSVFSLDAHTLAQAHGYVLCGHCRAGFDSLATLTEHLPPEPFRELPTNNPAPEPPRLELVVYRPRAAIPAAATQTVPIVLEDPLLTVTPRFIRDARKPTSRRWPWVLACFTLLLILLSQLGWACRDVLIADPTVGPMLSQVCATLNCTLPLVRDVRQLHLLARDVQTHPSVPGALMISATVRNDAAFAQPWPVVSITLYDVNGKRLAMRRLSPSEYLSDNGELQRGLAAAASTALVFEVEDPGQQAVTFELGFE